MAFEEGHIKLGGRQKGALNKKTLMKAEEILTQLDINPIQKLIDIAESGEATIDQKINCYKEIAKYALPKPKSQDIHQTGGVILNVVTGIDRAPGDEVISVCK